jgi:YaiO family outer membrane protein
MAWGLRFSFLSFSVLVHLSLVHAQQNPEQLINREELAAEAFFKPAIFDSQPYIEAGATMDRLTNNYAPWSSEYVNLVVPLHTNGLINLQVDNLYRFNQNDQNYSASYLYPMSLGVLNIDAAASPTANFTAQTSFGLGWNGYLPEQFGYILLVNQRQFNQNYNNVSLNIYNLGVEKYIDNFRLAYVGVLSSINQSPGSFAQRLQLQWLGDDNNRIGLAYAQGFEPAVVSLNNLASIKTQYLQLDGMRYLSKDIAVTAAIWHGYGGGYYVRNGGQLGLRLYF